MTTPLKSSRWFAEGIPNFQEISAFRRTVVSRELNMRILCPMFDNSRTHTRVARKVVREMLAVSVSVLGGATVSPEKTTSSSSASMSAQSLRPVADRADAGTGEEEVMGADIAGRGGEGLGGAGRVGGSDCFLELGLDNTVFMRGAK
jgi:hypothetical protein